VTRHVRDRKWQLAQGLGEEDRVAHCAVIERLRREEGRGARGCGRHGLDLGAWAGRIWGLVLWLRLWLWMRRCGVGRAALLVGECWGAGLLWGLVWVSGG
jgi:hypothetical protein